MAGPNVSIIQSVSLAGSFVEVLRHPHTEEDESVLFAHKAIRQRIVESADHNESEIGGGGGGGGGGDVVRPIPKPRTRKPSSTSEHNSTPTRSAPAPPTTAQSARKHLSHNNTGSPSHHTTGSATMPRPKPHQRTLTRATSSSSQVRTLKSELAVSRRGGAIALINGCVTCL